MNYYYYFASDYFSMWARDTWSTGTMADYTQCGCRGGSSKCFIFHFLFVARHVLSLLHNHLDARLCYYLGLLSLLVRSTKGLLKCSVRWTRVQRPASDGTEQRGEFSRQNFWELQVLIVLYNILRSDLWASDGSLIGDLECVLSQQVVL